MENLFLKRIFCISMKQGLIRIIGLYLHYLNSMKRNPARLIEMIIWPVFEVMLFGLLAASHKTGSQETVTITATLLMGVVYWNCTARVIQEAVAQFVDDYFSKNIQNILITPASLSEILLSIIGASLTKVCISLTSVSLVLWLVFPSFLSSLGWNSFLWVLQLELFGSALSLFAISLVFLAGQRVSFAGWMISTIVQVFSLVFYARSALPSVLFYISYVVPSSYIFEAMRFHTQPIQQFIAFGITLGYLFLGVMSVKISFQWARWSGTLIKL